jgi:hypothetical protein
MIFPSEEYNMYDLKTAEEFLEIALLVKKMTK